MNKNSAGGGLTEQIRRSLDHEVAHLDATTIHQLRRARLRALRAGSIAENARESEFSGWLASFERRRLFPRWSTSLAALLVGSVLLFSVPVSNSPDLTTPQWTEDGALSAETEPELNELDVLMSNEDMEFLENLEVYEWLVAEYG